MPSSEVLNTQAQRFLERNLDEYEKALRMNYREGLKQIRQDISKIYERYAVQGKLSNAEMTRFNRLSKLEKQLTEDIRPTFRKNQAIIDKVSATEYEEAFFRYAYTVDQQVGIGLRWGTLNPKAIEAAVSNPLIKIAEKRLRQDGLIKIQRAVAQGLVRGVSYPNMMKSIRNAINGNAKDAMRIVRTEGGRAQSLGQKANYEKARELGVEVREFWVATLDGRTRDDHQALDGQEASVDSSGETYWQVPGIGRVDGPHQSGVAEFDINCRCRVRGETANMSPPVERRIRDEGVQPYQTYTEWRKKYE